MSLSDYTASSYNVLVRVRHTFVTVTMTMTMTMSQLTVCTSHVCDSDSDNDNVTVKRWRSRDSAVRRTCQGVSCRRRVPGERRQATSLIFQDVE